MSTGSQGAHAPRTQESALVSVIPMHPARTGSKGMPRHERERWILDAAAAEFGAATYVGTQLHAVATTAGVSKALVIAYFGSKEDLYIACVERAGQTLATAIGEALSVSPTGADAGERVLAAIFGTLAHRFGDWPLLYDRTIPVGRVRDAAREQRTVLRQQAAAGVRSALAAAGLTDPDDLSATTLVWENTVSALVQWWQRHPERSADEMAARGRRVLAALSGRPVAN